MSRRKVMFAVLLVVFMGLSAISYASDEASHTVTIAVPEVDKIWVDGGGTLELYWEPFDIDEENKIAYPNALLDALLKYVTNASDRKITAEASGLIEGLSLSVNGEDLTGGAVILVQSCEAGSVQKVELTYDGKADIVVPAGNHEVLVTYTITN
ncbi:MAG: hypothetical protein GX460_06640 [Firmicutes bacterium]|nr:hypothetical protein [Bacillota bacterium]